MKKYLIRLIVMLPIISLLITNLFVSAYLYKNVLLIIPIVLNFVGIVIIFSIYENICDSILTWLEDD